MPYTPTWDFPHASRRIPVLAANAVCTTQPLASQAGLRMLLAGGNAVDAALATAITLNVVEPVMNGIGGDAFVLVWDGQRLHGLNASGRAPAGWTRERFAGRDAMPELGWDTVTVPGQVAGWAELSRRFGKLPFADLFGPAIEYAANGFAVSPVIARQWANQAPRLKDQPGYAQAFMPEGRTPQAGEIWRFPDQARTLERIAASGGRDFYEGETAERIAAYARETGGAMTLEDLAAHRCDWVEPISMNYRDGYALHELPPNGQGIAALMALGMLDTLDAPAADDPDWFHLPIEAVKLAFADLHEYVADPAHMDGLTEQLLDRDYLARRAPDRPRARVRAGRRPARQRRHGLPDRRRRGRHDGVLHPVQLPRLRFGRGRAGHRRVAAQPRPLLLPQAGPPQRSRAAQAPMHTIIPGFITQNGQPLASFGVMGGNMQAQGHVQVMQQIADLRRQPQAAIDAPRFRVEAGPKVMLEAHVPAHVTEALRARGHTLELHQADSLEFGAGQMILRQPHGGYIAASDPRRDGQAVGF